MLATSLNDALSWLGFAIALAVLAALAAFSITRAGFSRVSKTHAELAVLGLLETLSLPRSESGPAEPGKADRTARVGAKPTDLVLMAALVHHADQRAVLLEAFKPLKGLVPDADGPVLLTAEDAKSVCDGMAVAYRQLMGELPVSALEWALLRAEQIGQGDYPLSLREAFDVLELHQSIQETLSPSRLHGRYITDREAFVRRRGVLQARRRIRPLRRG